MFQGKTFSSDDEVIAAPEAYFKAKDKSFYQNDWNDDCIAMEGDYVDRWSRILQKNGYGYLWVSGSLWVCMGIYGQI